MIDWTPFFASWELHGKFPKILDDEVVGVEATKLYNDARAMLQQMVAENWIEARAVFGLFPPTRSTTTTSRSMPTNRVQAY